MSNMNNKCCQYSFYIPANDQPLCDFLEAQSNLSMSIRLLIKAFLANYGDTIPDVTIVDLKELLNNMQFKEGIMDNIMDYKNNKPKKSVENSNESKVDVKEDMFGDVSKEEEINMDDFDDSNNLETTLDIQDGSDDIVNDTVDNNDKTDVIEQTPENMLTAVPEDISENMQENTQENTQEGILNNESRNQTIENQENNDDANDIPDVDIEPESPKKIINSSRNDYNSKQNAQSAASMEDIMSMLGE